VAACTGLTVNPEGRPCGDNHPCGPGTACDPATKTCVKSQERVDAQVTVPDLAVQQDGPTTADGPIVVDGPTADHAVDPDLYLPDTVSPDSFITPDAGCPTGLTQCGSECADLATSFSHCGSCNNACPSEAANLCVGGKCVCGTTGGLCAPDLNCVAGACRCVYGGRCGGCCDDNTTCVPTGSAQSTTKCGQNGESCKSCYDQNYCTEDTCAAGVCQSSPRPDGTQCSDGDDCTHSDACQGGLCKATPYSCDDSIGCTADVCLGTPPPNNCTNTLMPGHCLIAGVCFHDGDPNPAAICQQACQVSQSTSAWTAFTGPCVTTLAGNGNDSFGDGPALSASFNDPYGVAVDSSGKVYVADRDNHRIRVIDGGVVSTFAGTGTQGSANGAALTVARFDRPYDVAVDANGVVYVADRGNEMIRQISGGQVTTLAGSGTIGFADGPAATAQFDSPNSVAVDASGVVYVADGDNHRIRQISGGQVSTLAGDGVSGYADGAAGQARFDAPQAVAVDSAGNVYVADRYNHCIRKISGGQVSTIAGSGSPGYQDGPAATSLVAWPSGVAVDSSGKVYFAEGGSFGSSSNRIRTVFSGTVATLAGDGSSGYRDGPALLAEFARPNGLDVDSAAKVYVADRSNHRIRLITP
jgi:hypothetical protein